LENLQATTTWKAEERVTTYLSNS